MCRSMDRSVRFYEQRKGPNMPLGETMELVEHKQFKAFRHTYPLLTFALSVGMLYPNPKTNLSRILAIPLLLLTVAPLAIMIIIDMYYCWMSRDIVNIIRHSTVVGPFMFGYLKMFLMYLKRIEAKQLLDEIDRDYESYNHMTDDYKELAAKGVRNSLIYSERCWVMVVIICVMTFPVMAIVQTSYNVIFKSEPTKYMIHDLNMPFREPEVRFGSPQFEIIFAYSSYCAIMYAINFIGYDGFFGMCINHACMKIDLYCKALEDALKSDAEDVHGNIVKVIQEQCRLFEFVDRIQDTFSIWLGMIFLATMIQICNCLYHISEGHGFDIRYVVFVIASVIHVYAPCRYAAKLKAMSEEIPRKIYSCGWENVSNLSIWKMVLFMIARAQKPIQITAFNMLIFDMELFVSIMQSSYSMYTLLRS